MRYNKIFFLSILSLLINLVLVKKNTETENIKPIDDNNIGHFEIEIDDDLKTFDSGWASILNVVELNSDHDSEDILISATNKSSEGITIFISYKKFTPQIQINNEYIISENVNASITLEDVTHSAYSGVLIIDEIANGTIKGRIENLLFSSITSSISGNFTGHINFSFYVLVNKNSNFGVSYNYENSWQSSQLSHPFCQRYL